MREPIKVENKIAARLPSNRDCFGGTCYDSLWDRHYKCRGCRNCPDAVRAAHGVGAFVHGMASLGDVDALRGLRGLESVGRAVAAALSPGLALTRMIAGAVELWNQVLKGRWYRISGKRGNAKNHCGKVGQVAWIGEIERRSQYGTWSYGSTTRVGLRVAGEEKLVYVSAPNLEPVAEPTSARAAREEVEARKEEKKARDSVRPTFPAALVLRGKSKNQSRRAASVGCIVAGPHSGKRGEVFWMGDRTGKGLRVGVRIGEGREDVAWVDARDVVPAADARAYLGTLTDAAGVEVSVEEQVEGYVIALGAAGFDDAALAWARR